MYVLDLYYFCLFLSLFFGIYRTDLYRHTTYEDNFMNICYDSL